MKNYSKSPLKYPQFFELYAELLKGVDDDTGNYPMLDEILFISTLRSFKKDKKTKKAHGLNMNSFFSLMQQCTGELLFGIDDPSCSAVCKTWGYK
jgi:hypothetical protein